MPENGYSFLVDDFDNIADDSTKDSPVLQAGDGQSCPMETTRTLPMPPDESTPENREEEVVKPSCWTDFRNPGRAVPKLYYLLYFAGLACVMPFLPVYFRMNGLTASQNGMLGALRPFVNFWSGPLFSVIADRLRRRRLVLSVCTVGLILFTFLLKYVPSAAGDGCGITDRCERRGAAAGNGTQPMPPGHTTKLQAEPPTVYGNIISQLGAGDNTAMAKQIWQFTLGGYHRDVTSTKLVGGNKTKGHNSDNLRTFYLFAALVFVAEFFGGCVPGLADTVVVESLGQDHSFAYGRQRLWGAIGWGIANAAVGYGANALADSCGYGNYDLHFFLFAGVMALSIGPQVFLTSCGSERRSSPQGVVHIKAGLRHALVEVRVVAFFIAVFFLAVAMSIVDNFLFWFLSELCASETLLGLSLFFMALSEIPLFTVAGRIIAQFGHAAVLCFVFACYTIRFLAYSLLSNPWWVLPIELLHGVTFALMWSCSVSYAKKIAPPRLEATMQGLLNGIYWGFGRGVGSLVGGFVYSQYGARWLFRFSAVGSVCSGCLYALAECLKRRQENRAPASPLIFNDSNSDHELRQGTSVFMNGRPSLPAKSADEDELLDTNQTVV